MRRSCTLLVWLLPLAGLQASELLEQLDDAGALAEYAYYAEEPTTLERLSEQLGQLEAGAHAGLAAYYRGLTAYRLAQLGSEPARAAAHAGLCTEELGKAVDAVATFAEAYALQAACYALRAELEPLKAVLYRPLADRRMERALELDAGNPRVLLLDALRQQRRARGSEEATRQFRAALARFEAEQGVPSGYPRWGEAEAWTYIGEIELARQDIIAARNAFEHALLIAPDYLRAQRLLRQLVALSH